MKRHQDTIPGFLYRLFKRSQLLLVAPEAYCILPPGELVLTPDRSPGEMLDSLYGTRREKANLVESLPCCPMGETGLLYLYDQIRSSLLFGVDGAAIVFSRMLVEHVLRYSICMSESGRIEEGKWEVLSEFRLATLIDRAINTGLIDAGLRDMLRGLRDEFKHHDPSNIEQATEKVLVQDVRTLDADTGEEMVLDLPASYSPFLQLIAKEEIESSVSLEIFKRSDNVARLILDRIRPVERAA